MALLSHYPELGNSVKLKGCVLITAIYILWKQLKENTVICCYNKRNFPSLFIWPKMSLHSLNQGSNVIFPAKPFMTLTRLHSPVRFSPKQKLSVCLSTRLSAPWEQESWKFWSSIFKQNTKYVEEIPAMFTQWVN